MKSTTKVFRHMSIRARYLIYHLPDIQAISDYKFSHCDRHVDNKHEFFCVFRSHPNKVVRAKTVSLWHKKPLSFGLYLCPLNGKRSIKSREHKTTSD